MKMQLTIKLSHFRDTWTHLRGCMEPGLLLVDEEGVRHPDELDVVRPHHQLLEPPLRGNRGSQGPSLLVGTGYSDKDRLLQMNEARSDLCKYPNEWYFFGNKYLLSVFLLPFLKSVSFQKLSVSREASVSTHLSLLDNYPINFPLPNPDSVKCMHFSLLIITNPSVNGYF